ncbi:MAG: TetR/AcrR family transcriptional regulator C-terminal domain-containing protein [Tissierellia bacterium]|nr:TetR/AcrR family transcriptional regulator C-terminal domain-containing protein [Tissierellia bacterium]
MANFTKEALGTSLKELLEEKSLDKIRVKDITDHCNVNRQTFYYHFQDIYDLLEWIVLCDLEKAIGKSQDYENWKEYFKNVFFGLSENKKLVLHAYHHVNTRNVRRFLLQIIRPIVSSFGEELSVEKKIHDEDLDFIIDFYTYGLIGIITEWFDDDMPNDYEEKLDSLFYLLDGSMLRSIEKFEYNDLQR